MEKELNIAAILKDKPTGIKLYSITFGDCTFEGVVANDNINLLNLQGAPFYTDEYGKYGEEGECLIFPSHNMRNWSKFAWKKGDVLAHNYGLLVMFDSWANDKYTEFYTAYSHYPDSTIREKEIRNTSCFSKVSEDIRKKFIDAIVEHYGGKLNLSTLEIEKLQFKDGDVFTLDGKETYITTIGIFRGYNNEGRIKVYAAYNIDREIDYINVATYDRTIHPATYSEKQLLFDALAKEGKRWNPETKTLENLPKKYKFKTMDYFLARYNYSKDALWNLYQYAFTDKDGYIFVVNESCIESDKYTCIPYNDQTAHLLGTTDDWKGGEE